METPEVAALQKEIARLNQIITVLLEQNAAQKALLAHVEKGKGQKDDSIAHAEKIIGTTEDICAVAEKGKGTTDDSIAVSEKDKGTTNHWWGPSEKDKGTTEHILPDSEKDMGTNPPSGAVPVFIPLSHTNVGRLYFLLKESGFKGAKTSAIQNAARLMLHFHNGGGGSSKELMQVTGLSRFGLAKHLRSLKSRGWIVRDSWQRYKLTPAAVSLLGTKRWEG